VVEAVLQCADLSVYPLVSSITTVKLLTCGYLLQRYLGTGLFVSQTLDELPYVGMML
jgi:hypothetical protein